ncbi:MULTISPECIES: hypothetical protein [unclassified Mesorhizobium]|uniref:hypothetical protein n=1 Tax=unclassified Mesorhizobium TaxID=325217 RepID=UPI001671A64F|nr:MULTISPECIES: hypothetical protein [unclassified Mesorhizobium]
MNPSDLIGAAGATSIRLCLDALSPEDGMARYLLDRLTGEQVAAITRALLTDPKTTELLKIALPRSLVSPFGLPDSLMTDERMVAIRHSDYNRPALLFATQMKPSRSLPIAAIQVGTGSLHLSA